MDHAALSLLPFVETGEFGQDKINAMHEAFVNVCSVLKISERAGGLTEQVAMKIVELARSGESDPTQLTRLALHMFDSSRPLKKSADEAERI